MRVKTFASDGIMFVQHRELESVMEEVFAGEEGPVRYYRSPAHALAKLVEVLVERDVITLHDCCKLGAPGMARDYDPV